ncbi:JAB domain-containing protein [Acetobacter cibinongensis]|uniref:JAB domain-containing protein n=1 Tax=Acetobacter cibinongensis TaxID=146475 RepID=UPI000A38C0F0|nr:DNA repair protein RadC [Acetobacter cibinongensis]
MVKKASPLLQASGTAGTPHALSDAANFSLDGATTPIRLPFLQDLQQGHTHCGDETVAPARPSASDDVVLLTRLILAITPREKQAEDVAVELISRFGSFAAVISAPCKAQERASGGNTLLSIYLQLVYDAARRMQLARLKQGKILLKKEQLEAYLRTVMGHEDIEQVRILFLDSAFKLLADEVSGRGTIDHAPLYPREVVRRALELQSPYLVLVHNHPSGDPTPSQDDIDITYRISKAAQLMGITVWDHVIVGHGLLFSFRQEGLL